MASSASAADTAPSGKAAVATATLSLALVSALYGATAPSPLYTIYQARLGLSTTAMASLYAAYIVGVLLTLGVLTRLRKGAVTPQAILQVGLLSVIAACAVLSFADSLSTLYLGRLLGGIGTGAITGTASAKLAALDIEHRTSRASLLATGCFTAGAAIGPLVTTGMLMAHLAPLVTPFAVNALLAAGALAGLRAMRGTWASSQANMAERPAPLPATERLPGVFVSYWTVAIAWITGAFFVALAPKFLAGLSPAAAHSAGLVVTIFQIVAGFGQVFADRLDRRFSVVSGSVLLASGWGACVAATVLSSPTLFWVGSLSCALGYAALFVGSSGLLFDTLHRRPDARGAASRFWMSGYCGAASSVIAIGWLMDHAGPRLVVDIVALVSLGGLCVSIGMLWQRRNVRGGMQAVGTPMGIWRARARPLMK